MDINNTIGLWTTSGTRKSSLSVGEGKIRLSRPAVYSASYSTKADFQSDPWRRQVERLSAASMHAPIALDSRSRGCEIGCYRLFERPPPQKAKFPPVPRWTGGNFIIAVNLRHVKFRNCHYKKPESKTHAADMYTFTCLTAPERFPRIAHPPAANRIHPAPPSSASTAAVSSTTGFALTYSVNRANCASSARRTLAVINRASSRVMHLACDETHLNPLTRFSSRATILRA